VPSVATHVAKLGLRTLIKRRLVQRELCVGQIHRTRAEIAAAYDRRPVPDHVTFSSLTLGGVTAERCVVTGPRLPARVVLYLHGGGFMVGTPRMYRKLVWRLARATGAAVVTPEYRLAPEAPWPAAPDDAFAAYRALLDVGHQGTDIAVIGDSAGGNLVLVLLQRLRAAGLPLPASAAVLSPWADLCGASPSLHTHAARDPMLPADKLRSAAEMYAAGADLADPLVSPVYGDFAGLPPLLIHAGSAEVLVDDARRVAAAARAAGVDVELKVWDAQPHVFHMLAALVPEARSAIDEVGRFAVAHWFGALEGDRADPVAPAPSDALPRDWVTA
jgi:acetyl esterase/lipase